MIRELAAVKIFMLLLPIFIGGCQTTSVAPSTEQVNPIAIPTAVNSRPEAAPTIKLSAEPASTPVPTPTAEVVDPFPGWESYVNEAYQFGLRYPATWALDEEPNLLKFRQETWLLAIAFQRHGENIPAPWTGMPAGESISRGTMRIMGQEIDKRTLVHEARVKALMYGVAIDDLKIVIRLDDMAGANYDAIDISQAMQDEIDQIVGSLWRW